MEYCEFMLVGSIICGLGEKLHFCVFFILTSSAFKSTEHVSLVEHLNLWFTYTHEVHKIWYPTNNKECTVAS